MLSALCWIFLRILCISYYKNHGDKFQKCFLDPNNHLSTNQKHIETKIGESLKNGEHKLELIIQDSYQNTTSLQFNFQLHKKEDIIKNTEQRNIIKYNQVFEFKNEDIEIYIPDNSLYKNHQFQFEKIINHRLKALFTKYYMTLFRYINHL